MKIITLYYDRFDSATTSQALSEVGIEHIVLCHDRAEQFTCIGSTGKLIETNRPKGIQHNLNYALDMVDEGEWLIIMSDDFRWSKIFVPESLNFLPCGLDVIIHRLKTATTVADKIGIHLLGTGVYENAVWASKIPPIAKGGLVDGKLFAIKKTKFRFNNLINTMTDYEATAYHLKHYGANMIFQHYYAEFGRFTKDGIGTLEQRLDDKMKDVKILLKQYPDILHPARKKNVPDGAHISFRKKNYGKR